MSKPNKNRRKVMKTAGAFVMPPIVLGFLFAIIFGLVWLSGLIGGVVMDFGVNPFGQDLTVQQQKRNVGLPIVLMAIACTLSATAVWIGDDA